MAVKNKNRRQDGVFRGSVASSLLHQENANVCHFTSK